MAANQPFGSRKGRNIRLFMQPTCVIEKRDRPFAFALRSKKRLTNKIDCSNGSRDKQGIFCHQPISVIKKPTGLPRPLRSSCLFVIAGSGNQGLGRQEFGGQFCGPDRHY